MVLKGAKTVVAPPDGPVASRRSRTPALATGGTGDVLAGTIGSLLAQGVAPFDGGAARGLPPRSRGRRVRERFGDAGLLASDLPEAIAIARKRLAAIAERKATAGRLGFGPRDGGRPVRRRRPLADPASGAATDGAPRPGPIEDRLAAAGLPPLPRTAWLELDLDALTGNLAVVRELAGPGVLVEPVVKADAYGHGMVPIARALVAAGADGLCVATLDEALALRGRRPGPILVLYPIPPGLARCRRAGSRSPPATRPPRGLLAAVGAGARPTARRRARDRDRPRAGRGAAGWRRRRRARSRDAAAVRAWPGSGPTSRPPRTRSRTAPRSSGSRPRSAALAAPASTSAAARGGQRRS